MSCLPCLLIAGPPKVNRGRVEVYVFGGSILGVSMNDVYFLGGIVRGARIFEAGMLMVYAL